jgi:hypothetical protein
VSALVTPIGIKAWLAGKAALSEAYLGGLGEIGPIAVPKDPLLLAYDETYINSRSGNVIATRLPKEATFYRIWGNTSPKEGSWLSIVRPLTRSEAINGLALEPGNTAQFISEVTVPAGTRVQFSVASKLWGRPGGWMQVELLEFIPAGNFGTPTVLPIGLLP